MRYSSLTMLAKLSLALQHVEQAGRSLILIQIWAQEQNNRHLEQGLKDLLDRAERLSADLRSLAAIFRVQITVKETPEEGPRTGLS